MEVRKPSKLKKILYWLTCWRPITKYEMVKMYQVMIKVQQINDSNILRLSAELEMLKKQTGVQPKSDTNNIDKGMYE